MTGFLNLSAELRNEVYSFVAAQESDVTIKSNQQIVYSSQRLIATSALITVNKQINTEYYLVLLNYAFEASTARIAAEVTDFDFGHLVTFLHSPTTSTPARLNKLKTYTQEPKVLVKLKKHSFPGQAVKLLESWSCFCMTSGLPVKYNLGEVEYLESELWGKGVAWLLREIKNISRAL